MYKRNCPKCGNKLKYKSSESLEWAIRKNNICRKCAESNRRMKISKGLKLSYDEGRKKKYQTIESRKKIKIGVENYMNSLSDKEKNQLYGEKNIGKQTPETRKKKRLSAIKRIKRQKGQICPAYNINAISIIEQKAKVLGITDLQHAENGGEFHIKELGYWVDGYSPSKNVVIEYYEKVHNKTKDRDERRKKEIVNFLNCDFIEIKET